MNRLALLLLILVSNLAFAANTGSLDEDDDTPAVTKPAVKAVPSKPSPAPATVAKPVATAKPAAAKADDEDEDEDDDDEEEEPVKPVRQRLLSPATAGRSSGLDDENEGTFRRTCVNCSGGRAAAPAHIHTGVRITAQATVLNSPIWASFARNFARCAPGCQPTGMGVWRDRYARPRPSCHHNGQAIDVAGMVCSGVQYRAIRESGRGVGPFSDMVRCMRGSMKTLYRVQDHYDHAHFSNGCVASGYRMY